MAQDIGEELIALLPRLRRFAISLAGSRANADDLVQTACERALAHAVSWRPGTRFDAWVFRILRNAWIDGLRQNRTRGIAEPVEDHEYLASGDGAERIEARLTLKSVLADIELLPPEQREVLFLVCVEDLTYAEAAEVAGIPIGTVMSRLARARAKIAERAGITPGVRR